MLGSGPADPLRAALVAAAFEVGVAGLTADDPMPWRDALAGLIGWVFLASVLTPWSRRLALGLPTALVAAGLAVPAALPLGTLAGVAVGLGILGLTAFVGDHVDGLPLVLLVGLAIGSLGLDHPPLLLILAFGLWWTLATVLARRPAGLAALPFVALAFARGPGPLGWGLAARTVSGAPDVVLVTVDTLRADVAAETRTWAALGGDHEAWSPSPWTLPALATLHTGAPPAEHGAGRGQALVPLDDALPTLAERFQHAGWVPVALSAGSPFTGPRFGLWRGFQRSWHPWDPARWPLPGALTLKGPPRPLPARVLGRLLGQRRTVHDADAMVDRALDVLQRRRRPVFLWVHLMDCHLPYPPTDDPVTGALSSDAPREALLTDPFWRTPEGLARLEEAYRAQVDRVDAALLRLVDGVPPDTILAITADHGEELGDRGGFEHGHTLHAELLRVPLALQGATVPGPVGLGDVGSVLLSAAGLHPRVEAPGPWQGSDLLYGGPERAVRDADRTLIVDGDGPHLYDRHADPTEREDRAAAEPEQVRRLEALLPPVLDGAVPAARDAVAQEQLESLGYLTP